MRPPVDVPVGWQGAQTPGNTRPEWPAREWWRSFDHATLNELEPTALANNHDLKAALSRLAQARASVRIAGASRYPTVGARLRSERTRAASATVTASDAELVVAFDPDLWGEQRGIKRSWQALAVAVNVAGAYFQLAAFDERIELVRQTIETARRIDTLVEARFRAGAVSDLDLTQSKTSLESIRAGLPVVEQGQLETLHALAIPLGQSPNDLAVHPPPITLLSIPASLPVGLSSDLLQRRPDIRETEANLMAANADLGAARARLLPSIVLTGEGGYASDQLLDLIRNSSSQVTLGMNLLTPIFHGGARRAAIERSSERYNELLHLYHQTVLGAFRDVEDTLVALQKLSAEEDLLSKAEQHATRAFELAEVRYRSGAIDAFATLAAQNTWLKSQNSMVQTRFARMNAHVSLYRVLGGGV